MTDAGICSESAETLIQRGRRNVLEGNLGSAREALLKAAGQGSVDAHIELADIECREGSPARAQLELDKAAALARDACDPHAFVALSGAYQLMLGSGELHEQQALALASLERAAELGLASAQATIAHWYRLGLNGAKADAVRFRYWVQLAADSGDPLAICELVEDLLERKMIVPNDLAHKVRALAPEYEEARRLLKKLK
jgi:TPR repeat protein